MAKRQRVWAAEKRDELFSSLGKLCAKCGSTEQLEFDVIVPIDSGRHHDFEWSWRISFYRREFDRGNLQVLCSKCNSRKQNQLELLNTAEIEIPF